MRHSIERKILVPFLIIVLLPSFIIGAVSMWSSYQSDKQFKQATASEHLKSLDRYAENLANRVQNGTMSEGDAKALIKMMIYETNGLYVEDEKGELTSDGEVTNSAELDWYNGEAESSWFVERRVLIEQLEDWNWTLYSPLEFSFYSGSLPDIQKYTLLISIFTGIIAVQFTIILSYNLSKPIKNLADFCKQIALGEQVKDLDIKETRKDEIGVLSTSLKEMVQTLDERNIQIEKIKQLNETILNSVHVGMVLITKGSESVYNKAAHKMMNNDTILERRVKQFTIHETSKREEEIWDHKVNEEKIYYAVNYMVIGGSGKRSILTFEDITHRRKLELRVERMSRLASLGEMASGIAHEIRNPLAGIKATTELLIRRLELSDDQLTLTENMLLDIDRLNKIITNTLQFSSPMNAAPTVVRVDDVVRSLFVVMERIANEKNVRLHQVESNAELMVDRDHLRQILLNLMINGMSAMPEGGDLTIDCHGSENDRTIMIRDTGIGMSDDVIEKIFDPFYTTRAEGTGLGLSIVHQLVVQNNGEIDVRSTPGKGTTFFLTFPSREEEI
ncbi:sensor histidine kinase [Guptibacillus hwajinpoensis]|uniref:histidine kinase n=1 Tax=Guptibacillus hwajinpoensis TaxID=208199 RepID=A0ABU0K5J1_9BACL|nr:ATP-binding protein [Alkalihalobacillus hemicentroti]MDQ0483776.1 signal transduction histidine kinase/HAMP domain-containing protein [Alkalihalobacillus hemicentroti]